VVIIEIEARTAMKVSKTSTVTEAVLLPELYFNFSVLTSLFDLSRL
jgi:hypothetical protein